MIETTGLTKSFGPDRALAGVDLHVAGGTVLGLLGPNGAGKTTLVRILATLLRPDEGRATVAGRDVVREPRAVRAEIGLTGQYASIDDDLSGRENLEFVGRLSRLSGSDARRRAADLLDRFSLTGAADRRAAGYSGGMRRRLDLAASLVASPRVLFLDEPTTGLDPSSRQAVWELIRGLADDGATVLLTTQYMEEADRLSDRVAVLDRGREIASGTPAELKRRVGGQVLELRPAVAGDLGRAADAVAGLTGRPPEWREQNGAEALALSIGDDTSLVPAALRRLDDARIAVADVRVHEPTLDAVFLAMTGAESGEKEETS